MKQFHENRKKQRFVAKKSTLSIDGKQYQIFNINEYGVGFLIDTPQEIEIGVKIEPIISFNNHPIRMTGVARHISQFHAPESQLYFQTGWVCGTEFTTQHDPEGLKLFKDLLSEDQEEETR